MNFYCSLVTIEQNKVLPSVKAPGAERQYARYSGPRPAYSSKRTEGPINDVKLADRSTGNGDVPMQGTDALPQRESNFQASFSDLNICHQPYLSIR
jgi:hypothetical protein